MIMEFLLGIALGAGLGIVVAIGWVIYTFCKNGNW